MCHVLSKICQCDQKHTLFSNFACFCTPKRCTRVHCLVLKNNPNYVNYFTRMISNFKYKFSPPLGSDFSDFVAISFLSTLLLPSRFLKPYHLKAIYFLLPYSQVSKLVASEILRQPTVTSRAAAIEKWAAVADICRCIHNYNSVLEITSALMNSSVYRLKKVWDKVNKQVSRYKYCEFQRRLQGKWMYRGPRSLFVLIFVKNFN